MMLDLCLALAIPAGEATKSYRVSRNEISTNGKATRSTDSLLDAPFLRNRPSQILQKPSVHTPCLSGDTMLGDRDDRASDR